MMLINMLPVLTPKDVANLTPGHSEYLREINLAVFARSVQFTDCSHFVGSEFGTGLGIASKNLFGMNTGSIPVSRRGSSTGVSVMHIVSGRASIKVRRIDACPNIASMKHPHAIWYRAMSKDIGRSRRGFVLGAYLDTPVSASTKATRPEPTSIGTGRFVYFRPEAFDLFCGKIRGKHWNVLSSGPVGAPTPRPAFDLSLSIPQSVRSCKHGET